MLTSLFYRNTTTSKPCFLVMLSAFQQHLSASGTINKTDILLSNKDLENTDLDGKYLEPKSWSVRTCYQAMP